MQMTRNGQGQGHGDRSAEPPGGQGLALAAYAACATSLPYAAVSFYWAVGGTAGLDTLGGSLEELGRARDPRVVGLT
jgi:hypothetical protein